MKLNVPESPVAVTCSPDDVFCAVSSISGKIYIWQIASGHLLRVLSGAHYSTVSVLKFTDDGNHLLSGGEDAAVRVWFMARLVFLGMCMHALVALGICFEEGAVFFLVTNIENNALFYVLLLFI